MLNYYQPRLSPFLHKTQYTLPKDISQHYYVSFEDGLWELLKERHIAKGSTIFVPDFYCIDVVQNIEHHGYRVVFYELNEHFQISQSAFARTLTKHQPAVIVVFHACGLTNQLITDRRWWRSIGKNTLVIEDSVHRLINPAKIQLYGPNHVIMDSLRKVSPLPGSMMYRHQVDMEPIEMQSPYLEWQYLFLATWWYLLFRLVLRVGMSWQWPALTKWAHEVVLKKHDDLIGDSRQGYRGWFFVPLVHRFFNFAKVATYKIKQVARYQAGLSRLLQAQSARQVFYQIVIPETDYGLLHVFPVGVRSPLSQSAIQWLHERGAIIWPKFPDAPWSKQRQVLFLPLGFHVSNQEITHMMDLLAQLSHQVTALSLTQAPKS